MSCRVERRCAQNGIQNAEFYGSERREFPRTHRINTGNETACAARTGTTMADTSDFQPLSKRRKLSLSEIPLLLEAEEESQQKETRGETEGFNPLISHGQPQEEDLSLSRDLEDEDTQIQCSLPLYLNHVFGSAHGRGSQLVPLTIEEHIGPLLTSQGFLVTTSLPPAGTPPREKAREELSISPVLFPSPVSLNNDVTDCDKSACKKDTTTVNVSSALKKNDTPEHSKDGDVRLRLASDTLQEKDTRKRKRSLAIGNTVSKGYKCPPTCTRFTDCTEPEKLVSLFGIALQGRLYSTLLWCSGYSNPLLQ